MGKVYILLLTDLYFILNELFWIKLHVANVLSIVHERHFCICHSFGYNMNKYFHILS